MTTRIYRYEVPVDDRWHIITSGEPLHVACRQLDMVEFWAYRPDEDSLNPTPTETRHFRVFGTGHPMPDELTYVGSAMAAGGALVWHLMSDPWKAAQ